MFADMIFYSQCFAGANYPDGKRFEPSVSESKWRPEIINGEQKMQVYECPAGYVLSRDDSFPDQDRCAMCLYNYYSLVPAVSNTTVCKPCPIGSDCPGGNVAIAKEGFWRRMQVQESEGNSTMLDVARVYRCPPGSIFTPEELCFRASCLTICNSE
jgi:hypothetical protein